MKKLSELLLIASLFISALPVQVGAQEGFSVKVAVPNDLKGELNGRILFVIDRDMPEDGLVFNNISITGCPVFGKTIFGLKAGNTVTLTASDPEVYGWPMQFGEMQPGEYAAQVFFVKYTQFTRSDGSVVWGMADQGGGGCIFENPFNLYSDAMMAQVGTGELMFELSNKVELGYELKEGQVAQQGNYEDTEMVRYMKIRSGLLSDFWGTDIYLGANILLPRDYDPAKKYPVIYQQGHFPGGNAPFNYGQTGRPANEEFTVFWDSDEAPQVIAVSFRDANMFYDTSYSVNSANLGPWGDAIVTELIPAVESAFSAVGEPWARVLAGGSTGGWESLAMQVFYPGFFGGTWALYADSVDFNYFQIVNLYEDENAYFLDNGWYQVERPSSRDVNGNVLWTIRDECLLEAAMGGTEHPVSLGQWAVWESVYGPRGEDGYPRRVWDPLTGVINHDVAVYWREHFDLNHFLQINWPIIGEKLVGKIHLRGGDMDSYYLNLSQYKLTEWLETTAEPYYEGYSLTFPRTGHSANMSNAELILEIADYLIRYGPEEAAALMGIKAE